MIKMNKVKKIFRLKSLFLSCCIVLSCSLYAKPTNTDTTHKTQAPEFEQYDPLIPQLFAFDKKNNIFAGINKADNTIDIIRYEKDSLYRSEKITVDLTKKRHDVAFIYRPQSVAIYDDYIVFLASHRDSCYLAILDLHGNVIKKLTFKGKAFAFSYSPTQQEMYIAGDHDLGYDVIAIDVSKGFENIELSTSPSLHYQQPKKSEEILGKDPLGVGMAMIAMSVVFLGLLMLYLSFKGIGNLLQRSLNKKNKAAAPVAKNTESKVPADKNNELTGEVLAAISAAIYLYNSELHDEENTVLTINKVSRNYSPWSSKLYGLNTYFNNRK